MGQGLQPLSSLTENHDLRPRAGLSLRPEGHYDQLYAQAMDAIYKGERYWFDQQETAELIAHNRKYQLLSPAEQYFRLCFEVCQDPSEGEYMSAADIFQRIKQVAGSSLGISAVTKFGQFLTNLDGIVHKRTNLGTVYLVKQKH